MGLLDDARGLLRGFGPTTPGDYLNRIVDAPAIYTFYDVPTANVLASVNTFAEVLATG